MWTTTLSGGKNACTKFDRGCPLTEFLPMWGLHWWPFQGHWRSKGLLELWKHLHVTRIHDINTITSNSLHVMYVHDVTTRDSQTTHIMLCKYFISTPGVFKLLAYYAPYPSIISQGKEGGKMFSRWEWLDRSARPRTSFHKYWFPLLSKVKRLTRYLRT